MTELEKMKMGEWYDANHDPKIIKQRYTAFDLCFEFMCKLVVNFLPCDHVF